MIFDDAFWRFACSGTLLGLYGLVEVLARRSSAASPRPRTPAPRWLNVGGSVSLLGFYLLIAPTGGAIAGGAGNLAGIALALIAMGARYAVRDRPRWIRDPAAAARLLFYTALPLAVGVPWGWLALTLPAYAMSAWRRAREGRALNEGLAEP